MEKQIPAPEGAGTVINTGGGVTAIQPDAGSVGGAAVHSEWGAIGINIFTMAERIVTLW